MWLLELNSRQVWLLPNHKYVLGRPGKPSKNSCEAASEEGTGSSAPDTLILPVKEPSVSRSHAVIEAESLPLEFMTHPSVQSKLFITDQNSKFGTTVNRKKISPNQRHQIESRFEESCKIKIGRVASCKVTWHPFVITCNPRYEDSVRSELHFNEALKQAQSIDIRMVSSVVKSTSVLMILGQPTNSAYFALTKGVHVVSSKYLSALSTAAKQSGVLELQEVIPDPELFAPGDDWKPRKERTDCLKGQKFYTDNEGLVPVITAAGGECTYAAPATIKKITPENDEILVTKNADSLGYPFVSESVIFAAIIECRPVQQRKRSGHSFESSSKHKRNRILDILTSDPVEDSDLIETPSNPIDMMREMNSQYIEPSVPHESSKMNDVITNSTNKGPTDGKSINIDSVTAEVVEEKPTLPRKRADQSRSNNKKPRKTDTPGTNLLEVAENTQVNETEKENEEKELDETELNMIGNLVLVENTLETTDPRQPSDSIMQRSYDGPNFKAFKRHRVAETQKVEYDEEIRDDYDEADRFAGLDEIKKQRENQTLHVDSFNDYPPTETKTNRIGILGELQLGNTNESSNAVPETFLETETGETANDDGDNFAFSFD